VQHLRAVGEEWERVCEAIATAKASILYLPPYNPDLNPIKQFFAKLNALLRKAGARTEQALWAYRWPAP
jgi:transposase